MRGREANIEASVQNVHDFDALLQLINRVDLDQMNTLIDALGQAEPNRFSFVTTQDEMRQLISILFVDFLSRLPRALPELQQQLAGYIFCLEELFGPMLQSGLPLTNFMGTEETFRAALVGLCRIENERALYERHPHPPRRNQSDSLWESYFWSAVTQPSTWENLKHLNLLSADLAKMLALAFRFARRVSWHYGEYSCSGADKHALTRIIAALPIERLPLIYAILTEGAKASGANEELYDKLKYCVFEVVVESGKLADLVGDDATKLSAVLQSVEKYPRLLRMAGSHVAQTPELQLLAVQTLKGLSKKPQDLLFSDMNLKGWTFFINTSEELNYVLGLAKDNGQAKKIICDLRPSEKCFTLIQAILDRKKLKNLSDENYSLLYVAGHKYSKEAKAKIAGYGERLLAELPTAEEEIKDAFGFDSGRSIEIILDHLSFTTGISLLRIMKHDGDAQLVGHLLSYFKCFYVKDLSPNQAREIESFKQAYTAEREQISDGPRRKIANVFGAAAAQLGRSNFVADLNKLPLNHQLFSIIRHLMERDGRPSRSIQVIDAMIAERKMPKKAAGAAPPPVALFAAVTPQEPSAPPQDAVVDHSPEDGPPGGPPLPR